MEKGNTSKGKTHQLVAVDRFWYSLEGNQLLSRNSLALNVARETVNIRYTNNLNATDRRNESCAFQDSGITSTGSRERTSAKHYFPL